MKLLKVSSFLNSPPPPPTQRRGSGWKEVRGCTFLGPGRTEGLESISKVSCFSLSRAPALSFLPDPPSMDGEAPLFSGSGRSRRMRATGSHCLPMGAPPSDPPDLHIAHVLPSLVTFTTWSPASTFPRSSGPWSSSLRLRKSSLHAHSSAESRCPGTRHPSFQDPKSSSLKPLLSHSSAGSGTMIFSLSLSFFFLLATLRVSSVTRG